MKILLVALFAVIAVLVSASLAMSQRAAYLREQGRSAESSALNRRSLCIGEYALLPMVAFFFTFVYAAATGSFDK